MDFPGASLISSFTAGVMALSLRMPGFFIELGFMQLICERAAGVMSFAFLDDVAVGVEIWSVALCIIVLAQYTLFCAWQGKDKKSQSLQGNGKAALLHFLDRRCAMVGTSPQLHCG